MLARHLFARTGLTSNGLSAGKSWIRGGLAWRNHNPSVAPPLVATRQFSFTFAGPRALDDIIKKELLEHKTGAEIADIWYTYHEARVSRWTFWGKLCFTIIISTLMYVVLNCIQENVHGLVYKGKDGGNILERAGSWYVVRGRGFRHHHHRETSFSQ